MLTKDDSKMLHGVAIMAMLALHLFCRKENLPYQPLLFIGSVPLVYYLGLFGDICVPIYCFTSGYAQYLLSMTGAVSCSRMNRIANFIKHYWLILVIFILIGLIVGDQTMPGSIKQFLGNALLFDLSYNGAWWFITTYIFLLLLTPCMVWLVNKLQPVLLVGLTGAVYFVSYVFYFNYHIVFNQPIMDWLLNQVLLLGRCWFSFVFGALFCKYKLFDTAKKLTSNKWGRIVVLTITPCFMLVGHAVVQSLIGAPITAMGSIICFVVWRKPHWAETLFAFFGRHSTNMWLVHMFFYLYLFQGLVFKLKYPLLVYMGLIGLSVLASMIIEVIARMLNKVNIFVRAKL